MGLNIKNDETCVLARRPGAADRTHVARRARRRFGEGNHPVALNFGDCFACALARTTAEPLLFKGEDFSQTDVDAA